MRTRRSRTIAILALAAVAAVGSAAADDKLLPCVGVMPFDSADSASNLSSVASSLTDFLTIDLKISGRVTVKSLRRPAVEDFTGSVGAIIADNKLDYLLFGTVKQGAEGEIDIMAYLANVQGERLGAAYRKLGSLFELSDAGDALFASLAKGIGTIHRGFGSIALAPEGEGSYDVYLNGELAGRNLDRIDDVLNGKHFIEVKQHRPFGETTLVSESLVIGEGERATLRFTIPAVLPEETVAVTGKFSLIDEEWDKSDSRDSVEDSIVYLESAFSDIGSCPGVRGLSAKTRQYRELWECRKMRYAIEDGLADFDPARLGELAKVYASAELCPDPDAVRRGVREDVAIADAIRLEKAIAAACEGNWALALAEYRAMAEDYRSFGMEVPRAFKEDTALLESVESAYASSRLERDRSEGLGRAASWAGAGFLAGAVGSMALDLPNKLKASANTDTFALNLAMGAAACGSEALEKIGVAGGAGLIAAGAAVKDRGGEEQRQDAAAATRAHYGQRLADAKAFLSEIAAPKGKAASVKAAQARPRLVVLSESPLALVAVGKDRPRAAPFVVNLSKPGETVMVDSGSVKEAFLAEARSKIAYARGSGVEEPPVQELAIEAGHDEDLLKGAMSISWEPRENSKYYRCIVFSKATGRADATIRIFDRLEDCRFKYFASSPKREFSFAVYAVDAQGYARPIASSSAGSEERMPFLSDRSRPVYFGGALGPTVMLSGSASGAALRVEPSAVLNLVPDKLMVGWGARFDLAAAGVADWGLYPLAVRGDMDRGFFQMFRAGLSSEKADYTIELGYGEGLRRFFFMPSIELGAKSSLYLRSVGFVIGRLF